MGLGDVQGAGSDHRFGELPSMTDWHAFDPYVQPVPTTPLPRPGATTTVVLFQRRVPSASGWSVGIS